MFGKSSSASTPVLWFASSAQKSSPTKTAGQGNSTPNQTPLSHPPSASAPRTQRRRPARADWLHYVFVPRARLAPFIVIIARRRHVALSSVRLLQRRHPNHAGQVAEPGAGAEA